MTVQEVREQVARQLLVKDSIRIISELEALNRASIAMGYTFPELKQAKDAVYALCERIFSEDIKLAA
jgi:hypothetical protein